MSGKNPWGSVKVEHEKVEDTSPETWFNAARKSIDICDFYKSLEQTKRGRQLDVDGQFSFRFDLLDIINYYDLDEYENARSIKEKHSNREFISLAFSTDELNYIKTFNELLKIDPDYWRDIWYGCIRRFIKLYKFSVVLKYQEDIDKSWVCNNIKLKHIERIVKNSNLRMLMYLNRCGYPLTDCLFDDGKNITMATIAFSSKEMVQYVLKKNYNNLNDTSHNGNTALFYAIERHSPGIVSYLIRKGAEVNLTNMDGVTPLMLACTNLDFPYENSENIIDILIDAGAKVDVFNHLHQNIVQIIINNNDTHYSSSINIITKLINQGVDITTLDNTGHDALYDAAIWAKNISLVDTLIKFGANVNRRYAGGKTLLHVIANGRHWDSSDTIIWMNIITKMDVNVQDDTGYTPLMYSVDHNWTFSDELYMARQLVKHGAKVNITDKYGRTVKSIMRTHNIDPKKLYNNESSNFFSKLFS